MAAGDRKGLPIKRKAVTRVSKSGKFSSYTQAYHLNPFKKTSSKDSPKQDAAALNKADRLVDKMKTRPAIDKRATIEGMVSTIDPMESMGLLKADKICSKLKTLQDVQSLRTNYLDSSLKSMNGTPTTENSRKINEHIKLFNNIPATPESYTVALGALIANKSNIHPGTFAALAHSFSNHDVVERAITKNFSKKESYDSDEFYHDWKVDYGNPVSHVINYYNGDMGDNLKSTVCDVWGQESDLTYMNKGVSLTAFEKDLTQRWIDYNNESAAKVVSGGLLKNKIYIKLDKSLAAMIYNSSTEVIFDLYNSTIFEFTSNTDALEPEDWKKIKDTSVTNDSNFTFHNCAFYMRTSDKQVFFIATISIKNAGDYNFISVSNRDTSNFIDEYNDKLVKSLDTSKLSEAEVKNKLWDLDQRYKNVDNYNSYLLT